MESNLNEENSLNSNCYSLNTSNIKEHNLSKKTTEFILANNLL